MPEILADRVQEKTTTTGTGALTLTGAVTGFRTFASVCAANDTFPGVIVAINNNGAPTGEWECGTYTYQADGTIARSVVTASSNGGAAVNFAAGEKHLFIDVHAARFNQAATHLAVNVKNAPFNAKGDGVTDDSVALQAAFNTANRVYLPAGTYLANDLKLKSNLEVFGDGALTIIKYNGASTDNKYLISTYKTSEPAGTYDPATSNMTNVYLHDIKLMGIAIGVNPYVEHHYLLNINATTDMRIERVVFDTWIGDAIYIGSGNTNGIERHNFNIAVRDCTFDGKNLTGAATTSNRQGISIIDGTDILIDGCTFKNIGRKRGADLGGIDSLPQMPAAIDVEPNTAINAFVRIRNINVSNCSFENIWNGGASLAVLLAKMSAYGNPPQGIRMRNCRVKNNTGYQGYAFTLSQQTTGDTESPTDATPPLGVVIENCWFENADRGFYMIGLKGAVLTNNVFAGSAKYSQIGFNGDDNRECRDVTFDGNTFRNMGGTDSLFCRIYSNEHITFKRNVFEDCGNLTTGGAIFNALNTSNNDFLRFLENRFVRSSAQAGAPNVFTQTGGVAVFGNNCQWERNVKAGTFGATNVFPTREGTIAFTPGAIAAGATVTSASVPTPGARQGDTVQVYPPSAPGNVIITGLVTADNAVTILIYNPTGNPITPPAGTWAVKTTARL